MKHEKTCALCVYFISASSCMPFPLRSHSSLYSSFSKHRLSLRKKNEEIFFKYVLRVGTILSPLSLIELKMAGEKRQKTLDQDVSHFSELL